MRRILPLLILLWVGCDQETGSTGSVPSGTGDNRVGRVVIAVESDAVTAGDTRLDSVGVSKSVGGGLGPRLAIVVDDIGYKLVHLQELLRLPLPLAFAVLPGVRYDRQSAALIRAAGHELLVHLAMEPKGYPQVDPGPCALLLGMSARELTATAAACVDRIEGASGVNNHMGSAFTTQRQLVQLLAPILQRRRLYFLDSLTAPDSTAAEVLEARGIAVLRRDVFADNERTDVQVRARINEAIRLAWSKGKAVLICHPYPVTIKVLDEMSRQGAFAGIQIVPPSMLLKRV